MIRQFAQHVGRNRRARIATVVAAGTTRRNSGMVHCRIGVREGGGVGVAYTAFLRGRNMVGRLGLCSGNSISMTGRAGSGSRAVVECGIQEGRKAAGVA